MAQIFMFIPGQMNSVAAATAFWIMTVIEKEKMEHQNNSWGPWMQCQRKKSKCQATARRPEVGMTAWCRFRPSMNSLYAAIAAIPLSPPRPSPYLPPFQRADKKTMSAGSPQPGRHLLRILSPVPSGRLWMSPLTRSSIVEEFPRELVNLTSFLYPVAVPELVIFWSLFSTHYGPQTRA